MRYSALSKLPDEIIQMAKSRKSQPINLELWTDYNAVNEIRKVEPMRNQEFVFRHTPTTKDIPQLLKEDHGPVLRTLVAYNGFPRMLKKGEYFPATTSDYMEWFQFSKWTGEHVKVVQLDTRFMSGEHQLSIEAFSKSPLTKTQELPVIDILLPEAVNRKFGLNSKESPLFFLGFRDYRATSDQNEEIYWRLLSEGIVSVEMTPQYLVHDLLAHGHGYWILSHHPIWERYKRALSLAFQLIDTTSNDIKNKVILENIKYDPYTFDRNVMDRVVQKLVGMLERVTNEMNFRAFVAGRRSSQQIFEDNKLAFVGNGTGNEGLWVCLLNAEKKIDEIAAAIQAVNFPKHQ